MERHSPVEQIRLKPPLKYRIQKRGTGDNSCCQMVRDISVRLVGPVKVAHLQRPGPKYSGGTVPKWSVIFDF